MKCSERRKNWIKPSKKKSIKLMLTYMWADKPVGEKLREQGPLIKDDDFFSKASKYAEGDYSMGKPVILKKDGEQTPPDKPVDERKAYGFEDADGDGNEFIDDAIIDTDEIVESTKEKAGDAVDSAKDAVESSKDKVKDIASDAVDSVKGKMGALIGSAKDAVSDSTDSIQNKMDDVADSAKDAVESAKDKVKDVASDAVVFSSG